MNRWYILAAFVIALSGCATVSVPMAVTHPAEINMTPYKQVAIGEIGGNMGQAFADSLKNKLVEGERFKVVDRNRMDQIFKELKLSQSDLADEKTRVKLGGLLSASAIITGRADGTYKENTTSKSGTCTREKREYSCTTYYRKGEYGSSGSIDVVDSQTGQIIRSKVLKAAWEATTSATDDTPEAIDKDSLYSSVLGKNVSEFMKAIMPWSETVMVPFAKDGKIPDLERGINQAKAGELQEAIKIFADAAKAAETNPQIKPDSIARAYWNLGLAYEYTFVEFDKAIEAFKKAYSLKPEQKYLTEKANVEKYKAEKKKLDEQTISGKQ